MTDSAADPAGGVVARAQYENDLAALRAEKAGLAARLGVTADRLAETEETLRAIRSGEIDALVVSTTGGDRLFTLAGADHPYRVMVESMQEGAATVSHDGFIRYANRRLGQLLDIPLHRLIGASASTFVAVDERANFERLLHDAARTGVYAEMKLQQAHGAAIAAYVAASPLHLADTPAVCLVITDLTELHQAQEGLVAANTTLERHSRRSEILAAASAAFSEAGVDDLDEVLDVVTAELVALVGDLCIIWLLNDGADAIDAAVVKSTDPAAAAAARGALHGSLRIDDHSPVAEVFRTGRPALAADVEGFVATFTTEYVEFLRRFRVQTMMFVPLRVRGQSRGVVTLSRFPPGVPYTADDLAIAVDIADRAAMSIENARIFRDKERAEARLREVNTELARSNADLEQFAYIASHDLQEPLRMVTSYTTLLAEDLGDRLDDTARRHLDFAHDGAVRMQQLVRDLLRYSRVSRGADTSRQPVDCDQLVETVKEDLHEAIVVAGASVTHDQLPTVAGIATGLRQLFTNLIGNAVKFRGDEPVRVHVAAARAGPMWRFSVTDNGIGIDPAQAERIFEVFKRLHQRGRYPGTGIGLAICKKVVEHHGGRVWVDSQPGAGATFWFTLPAVDNARGDR